ncbi:acetyl-CoA C-acetyltransferase [Bradyrhizobium sp. GM6.1]
MPEAFIYDHVRTPRGRGKADGALHEVTALALATVPLKALKDRNNLPEDSVDDVILGVVDPVGEAGSDIARFAALKAGLGEAVPGVQISRFCASGLDAVNFAAAQVMSGQHELVIGGGAESMSRVGIGASGGAWPMDPSMAVPAYFMPQGVSADLIATKYGFSRDDVDAYAVQSQQRAAKSWEEGRFDKSVVPVKDINGLTILAKDEHMRPSTTMQSLAQLQPAFTMMAQMGGFDGVAVQSHPEIERVNYVHHAGNSSGIVDGAGAVLLGSKEAGGKYGLKPRARIRAFANIGSEPAMMLTGPVDVTEKLFARSGMKKSDIDLFEPQRGLRLGCAALHPGLRHRQRQDQRQWRCDRARPSARRDRCHDPRDGARRARAHQQGDRTGDAVHRRRHGHRDHHRTRLRAGSNQHGLQELQG